jgi:hypothetical protein
MGKISPQVIYNRPKLKAINEIVRYIHFISILHSTQLVWIQMQLLGKLKQDNALDFNK